MQTIDENGAIQSLVSQTNTPDLFTPCHTVKTKNVNDLKCQLELLCDKANEVLSLDGNILTLLDDNGDTSSVDLTPYLDDTDTTYQISFDITSNEIVLIDSNNIEDRVVIDFNFSLLTAQQCQDLISNCSTELQSFVKDNETNTSLAFDSVNNVITYTNEDGTNFTVDLTKYLDDVTVVSGLLDTNTGIVTYTRDDASTFTVDFSGLLDDTNDFVVSGVVTGTDLVLTRDSGSVVTVDLSGFVSSVTPVVTGGNVIATHVDATGTSTDIEETITSVSINGNGIDFTDESGSVNFVDLSGIQTNDEGDLTLVGNNLTHTNSDGSTKVIDLSPYLDDTNDFVVSGVVTGTDLVLTRDSGTTLSIDITPLISTDSGGLAFDSNTNDLTHTNSDGTTQTVNLGTDLDSVSVLNSSNTGNVIASHDDGNGNVVSIQETVTTVSLNGSNLEYVDESGATQTVDLLPIIPVDNGSFVLNTTNNTYDHTTFGGVVSSVPVVDTKYDIELNGTILELDGSDGTTDSLDLSSIIPVHTPSGLTPTNTGNVIATHDDGAGNTTDIEETETTLTVAGNVLTYIGESGSPQTVDLSLYLDDTNLARIITGNYSPSTGLVTFTRDDSTTFDIDLSSIIPSETTTTIVDGNDGTFVYTNEDGVAVTIDTNTPSSDVTSTNSGNVIATHDDGSGNTTDIEETITDLQLTGTNLTYTNEDGVAIVLDLSTLLDDTNLPFITSGQFSPQDLEIEFTRDDGSSFVIDVSGLANTTSVITGTVTGNTIATHDDGNGNTVDINETVTTLGLNGNDLEYVDESGTTQTVDLSVLQTVDNGDLTFNDATNELTHTNSDGTTQVVDLDEICLSQLKTQDFRADLVEDQDSVTVAGFDPVSMIIIEAYVDSGVTGVSDGVAYSGRRNGNVFDLDGNPDSNYTGGFVVRAINTCGVTTLTGTDITDQIDVYLANNATTDTKYDLSISGNEVTLTGSDATNDVVDLSNICLGQIKTQFASFDLIEGDDFVLTNFDSSVNQILNAYINDDVVPLSDGVSFAGRRTAGINTRFGLVGRPDANYTGGFIVEYITKC